MTKLSAERAHAIENLLFDDEETLRVNYDGSITVSLDDPEAMALAAEQPEAAWAVFHIGSVAPYNVLGEYTLHDDGSMDFEPFPEI